VKTWPFKERITNVKDLMAKRGLDAIIVTSWANLYYLLGVLPLHATERTVGPIMPLLIPAEEDKETIFVPVSNFFLVTDAEHKYIQDVRPSGTGTGGVHPPVQDLVSQALVEWNVASGKIGVEFKYLTTPNTDAIKAKLPKATFVDCSDLVELLRMVKSEEEKAYCIKACEITNKVLQDAWDYLRVGRTEMDVAREIIARTIEYGGDGTSFLPQVFSGRRGCLTNISSSRDKMLQDGEIVLLDFGTVYKGYRCDQTRPFVLGRATKEQKEVSEAIKSVTEAMLEASHSGNTAADIHNAAVLRFSEVGYPFETSPHVWPYVTSGHGMGIETWERPNLSSEDKTVLQPNMFLALEQTIFRQPKYAIRYEENIFVTENGCVDYIKFPMELVEV